MGLVGGKQGRLFRDILFDCLLSQCMPRYTPCEQVNVSFHVHNPLSSFRAVQIGVDQLGPSVLGLPAHSRSYEAIK